MSNDQDGLDEPEAPYVKGSETSREAASEIDRSSDAIRAEVLECMRSAGNDGRTDQETQVLLSMTGNTQRPRRRELEEAGFVCDSGRTRKTMSNRNAVVWVVTEKGMTNPCPPANHSTPSSAKSIRAALRQCLSAIEPIVKQRDRSIVSLDLETFASAYKAGFVAMYGAEDTLSSP